MEMVVMEDIGSFGISILMGVLIGVLFDLYRTLRFFSKPKKILSYIEDLLFWVIIVLIFFMLLVKTTNGILRGFIFIGFFCGGMLYMLVLSKFLLSVFIMIFKLILEAISEIIKIILNPFSKLIALSKKHIHKVYSLPKVFFKEMGRYRKIISKKK